MEAEAASSTETEVDADVDAFPAIVLDRRVGTRYSLAPSGDDCNNTGVSTSVNSVKRAAAEHIIMSRREG